MPTPDIDEWTREQVAEMYGYAQTAANNLKETLELMDKHRLSSVASFSATALRNARGFQSWATQALSSANARSCTKGT